MIVGIDEVGRGAWAGPMAVGAVLLGGASIEGLTDSKKLTKKQREVLDIEIRQKALGIGIGWVSARVIDEIGLSAALKLASRRALAHIRHEYREIVIDGTIALVDDPRVTLMKKADLLVPCVSAASIVAKVARDNYMKHLDKVFPGYRFTGHVGYGTAAHRAAIAERGVTPLHRLSYAPLVKYARTTHLSEKLVDIRRVELGTSSLSAAELAAAQTSSPRQEDVHNSSGNADGFSDKRVGSRSSTSKQIGDIAENEVAKYLKRDGHEIIARNWRTKYCEIDIVSQCDDTLYFTEVKYRKNDKQGGGVAAVTVKKQRQMAFAAELYVAKHKMQGVNMRLAVADVAGQPPQVKSFLKLG